MNRRALMASTLAFAAFPAHAEETMQETDASLIIDGVRIPGRLCLPAGAPVGAVLIVPGSLFSDVDGDYPSWNVRPHVYRDLAHQLAARGVASLRQAKIGPGTGSETMDATAAAAHLHFAERVVVCRAALVRLRAAVPGVRVVAAGHSEGAVVTSLLGAESGVSLDGIVSLSGPSLRILDIMRAQTAAMMPGADMGVFDRAAAAIRAGQPLAEEARSNPMLAGMVSMPPQAIAYLREVDEVDPCAAIARVRQPMLLVQGGRDQSVTPEQVDALAAARGALPTQIERFAELQHFYKRAPEGLDAMQSFGLSDESDPAVAAAITAWMTAL